MVDRENKAVYDPVCLSESIRYTSAYCSDFKFILVTGYYKE